MADKKMTYAQALEVAINSVADVEVANRLTDLKASLEKKASSKKKVDNSGYFPKVVEILSTGEKTPTELKALVGVDTTQKMSAIVSAMPNVERVTKGKKTIYKLR